MSVDKKQAMTDTASETLKRMMNPRPANSPADKEIEARIRASQTLRSDSIGASKIYVAGSG